MWTRSLNRADDKHERSAGAQSRASSKVIIALNQQWRFDVGATATNNEYLAG
jgi:hypothetical protein